MKVDIRDSTALLAITPTALSAYARAEGWQELEPFGDNSDVYTAEDLPEIILPRTQRLGDYPNVVARLITVFADVADQDETSLYRDLVTADRDVVRVRVNEAVDGSISVNMGVNLIYGARDMLLATACSLGQPQPVYRARANKDATSLIEGIRLGQTEQGSFAVTLLTPVIPPPIPQLFPDLDDPFPPMERRMTSRLTEALSATRGVVDSGIRGDSKGADFAGAISKGVSANLCEALDTLIGPFPMLDVGVTWARTRTMPSLREVIKFATGDAPILREAARVFRAREPVLDTQLFGVIERLTREESEYDGTISLRTSIDGRNCSVTALLKQTDYDVAIGAHKKKEPVILQGDLDRIGQRWRLLNPRITDIIRSE